MKTLHLLIPCIIGLFWSCEKENVDQTTTSTSEVPIEITEINPGQALLRVAAEAPLAEMRFDSAYFFTRENNGEIEWFFNAEFGLPGETFFLKFTSEEMVAGDYPVSEFKIREFEDLDPNVSFAGEYNIENTGVFGLDMVINIFPGLESGVTGSLSGTIDSENGERLLTGNFLQVPIN